MAMEIISIILFQLQSLYIDNESISQNYSRKHALT